ncbi:MAG: hypothetical protein ACREBU_05855 [Nitrososphaera sp.]
MEPSPLAEFVFSGMLLDMVLGMLLGMAASPLVMRWIKRVTQQRKLSRVLHEIAESSNSSNPQTTKEFI